MKSAFPLLLLAALLSGCVVTQTRSGDYSFNFVDPGKTVAEFHSSNGKARLRKHLDGSYGLYFPEQLSQYRIGKYDGIALVAHHTSGGRTAALLERRKGDCIDYELVTIARGRVGKNNIALGCNGRLDAAVVDDTLVMRERVDSQARLWMWTPAGIQSGREPPPRAVVQPVRSAPAATARHSQANARVGSGGSPRQPPGTAHAPSAPAHPAQPRISLPQAGSIQTRPLEPTEVTLTKGP